MASILVKYFFQTVDFLLAITWGNFASFLLLLRASGVYIWASFIKLAGGIYFPLRDNFFKSYYASFAAVVGFFKAPKFNLYILLNSSKFLPKPLEYTHKVRLPELTNIGYKKTIIFLKHLATSSRLPLITLIFKNTVSFFAALLGKTLPGHIVYGFFLLFHPVFLNIKIYVTQLFWYEVSFLNYILKECDPRFTGDRLGRDLKIGIFLFCDFLSYCIKRFLPFKFKILARILMAIGFKLTYFHRYYLTAFFGGFATTILWQNILFYLNRFRLFLHLSRPHMLRVFGPSLGSFAYGWLNMQYRTTLNAKYPLSAGYAIMKGLSRARIIIPYYDKVKLWVLMHNLAPRFFNPQSWEGWAVSFFRIYGHMEYNTTSCTNYGLDPFFKYSLFYNEFYFSHRFRPEFWYPYWYPMIDNMGTGFFTGGSYPIKNSIHINFFLWRCSWYLSQHQDRVDELLSIEPQNLINPAYTFVDWQYKLESWGRILSHRTGSVDQHICAYFDMARLPAMWEISSSHSWSFSKRQRYIDADYLFKEEHADWAYYWGYPLFRGIPDYPKHTAVEESFLLLLSMEPARLWIFFCILCFFWELVVILYFFLIPFWEASINQRLGRRLAARAAFMSPTLWTYEEVEFASGESDYFIITRAKFLKFVLYVWLPSPAVFEYLCLLYVLTFFLGPLFIICKKLELKIKHWKLYYSSIKCFIIYYANALQDWIAVKLSPAKEFITVEYRFIKDSITLYWEAIHNFVSVQYVNIVDFFSFYWILIKDFALREIIPESGFWWDELYPAFLFICSGVSYCYSSAKQFCFNNLEFIFCKFSENIGLIFDLFHPIPPLLILFLIYIIFCFIFIFPIYILLLYYIRVYRYKRAYKLLQKKVASFTKK